MTQNTTFKGNKNNNQKRKLPYIKARIDKLVDVDDCNTKAFASVTVSGAVAIHGIRVMNSKKGLFVAMPASNYVDENGETKFSEIAHPISKESTFNNTIVTISDTQGNAISWASAGELGFRGSRKSTPFAAQSAAETAAKVAMEHGMKSVEVYVKGPGAGREAAIRALQTAGLEVSMIKDVTPIPHNGCRPPKRRRV